MRYGYVFKRVKELIDSGEVTPYMVNVKLNRGELLNPPWTADPKVTGVFSMKRRFICSIYADTCSGK